MFDIWHTCILFRLLRSNISRQRASDILGECSWVTSTSFTFSLSFVQLAFRWFWGILFVQGKVDTVAVLPGPKSKKTIWNWKQRQQVQAQTLVPVQPWTWTWELAPAWSFSEYRTNIRTDLNVRSNTLILLPERILHSDCIKWQVNTHLHMKMALAHSSLFKGLRLQIFNWLNCLARQGSNLRNWSITFCSGLSSQHSDWKQDSSGNFLFGHWRLKTKTNLSIFEKSKSKVL